MTEHEYKLREVLCELLEKTAEMETELSKILDSNRDDASEFTEADA